MTDVVQLHVLVCSTDIDLDEDLRVWGLPMLVHVLVQADPEAILAAAMTWRGSGREARPGKKSLLLKP